MAEFFNTYLYSDESWQGHFLAALVACILIIHVVAVGALVFIWLERKVSGRIQDRLGPTRVGGNDCVNLIRPIELNIWRGQVRRRLALHLSATAVQRRYSITIFR